MATDMATTADDATGGDSLLGDRSVGSHDADPCAVDLRARDASADADARVVDAWESVLGIARQGPGPLGLAAGERPIADVEVLAGLVASAEYSLARFLHAGVAAGCAPLAGRGALLTARGWSGAWANRLARAGALAERYADLAAVWAAGVITAEHVDALARGLARLTDVQLDAVVAQLRPLWGQISPLAVEQLVRRAAAMLRPLGDQPEPASEEVDAYQSRYLSFATLGDTVLLHGSLPRVEGELVQAAVEAIAEQLRTSADDSHAAARRADALVQLVNSGHAADALPSRGGLPVSLTVTLDHTSCGDAVWTTSRGHTLTPSEAQWASRDSAITPIVVKAACGQDAPPAGAARVPTTSTDQNRRHADDGWSPRDAPPAACPQGSPDDPIPGERPGLVHHLPAPTSFTDAARIAALAALTFDPRTPIAAGRTQRTATVVQRRALAVRDRGCIIPGCEVPAEACQVHHLQPWQAGGVTDPGNLVLLCWAHHRQVDLKQWRISPRAPDLVGHPGSASPSAREPGGPEPGIPWPAAHGAPFTVTRLPRARWRR